MKGPHINSTPKGCGRRLGGFYCSEALRNWRDRMRNVREGGASRRTQGVVDTSCFHHKRLTNGAHHEGRTKKPHTKGLRPMSVIPKLYALYYY
jgi:hypothetical protein